MKKIISSNELFKIVFVAVYDADEDSVSSYYELVEEPNTTIQIFQSYEIAEKVMKQKTEFWTSMLRKIPHYCEVRFIA
ncbi:MAG TPA: hypothetical protein VL995_16040 [Cellvibrio sp.]|nr:hypothetical protein [Cellvibrio sp.]